MDIQFDLVKSFGLQILLAYQEIHHPAVIEQQIPSVIFIYLQQRNITGASSLTSSKNGTPSNLCP